jgi:apolipoprotein N-acyltransferase
MKRGTLILKTAYLLIALAAFSVSIFRTNDSVWLAAWIAPVFLMRFVRTSRWTPAVLPGFVAVQAALFIALVPLFSMVGAAPVKVDARFVLGWQAKSGMLFLAPMTLIPFLLDKALHRRLPKWASALVFPAAVVTVETVFALTTGTLATYGETQYSLRPLVMTSTLFGLAGVSFMIAWTASTLNDLWEGGWKIKDLGRRGVVYTVAMGALLLYSAILTTFPVRPRASVLVAGITTEATLEESMAESGLYVTEISRLGPTEYAQIVRSSQSRIDELRGKTVEAINAGAEIVVWQELALLLEPAVADPLLEEMRDLADEADVYLLISYERLLGDAERRSRPMRNSSVLFTPEGETGWEYAKAFPAAGFEDVFTEPGAREIPYLDTPYGRIGQVICADMIHPGYLRQAAAKDIDLLLVPSWDTAAHTPSFTFASAYRTVEDGFTMVRITGDGQSAVIDPYYRNWAAQSSFDHGTINFYANVPVVSRTTFYGVIGFCFPYLAGLCLILLAGWGVVRALRARPA